MFSTDNSILKFQSAPMINPRVDTKNDKALKAQTDEFESLLLKQLLDDSLKFEDGLFGRTAGSDIYNSMYNDALSKASSGGFGFSNMLYKHLKENSTYTVYKAKKD